MEIPEDQLSHLSREVTVDGSGSRLIVYDPQADIAVDNDDTADTRRRGRVKGTEKLRYPRWLSVGEVNKGLEVLQEAMGGGGILR